MKTNLFRTFCFLLFVSSHLFGQESFQALYKIKGPVFNITEITNNDDLQKIAVKLGYDYYFGEKTAVRILRFANEKNWPEAINTPEKRKDPAVLKIMSKYTAFSLTSFNLNMFKDKGVFLLFIPKDKNEKMPEGFRPANDIFFLTPDAEFTKKNEKIDFKREDNLVTENYNFLRLNEIMHYFWYLNQMTVNNYSVRTDNNGNQLYNQPTGRELSGFYENIYIKTPSATCYAASYYDAGTDIEKAKSEMKHMAELICGGEFNVCHFKTSDYNNPLAYKAYRLKSDNCPEKPILLELALLENSKIDCKNKNKTGYTIMLAVKAPEDPAEAYWSELMLSASEKMKNSDNRICNTCKGKDGILRCDFKISTPKEISWDTYISYPDPAFYIFDEKNQKEITLSLNTSPFEKNIWQVKGSIKLAPGEYRFMGNPPAGNIGYWLVCIGEKDDKEKLAEFQKEQNKQKDLYNLAKASMTKHFNEQNYTDIIENFFFSEADSQYVRISYAPFKIQAFVSTTYSGLSVKVITGTGLTVVDQSKVLNERGLYLHGVYFETLKGIDYYIVIKNPSKKYDNTFLMHGIKK